MPERILDKVDRSWNFGKVAAMRFGL